MVADGSSTRPVEAAGAVHLDGGRVPHAVAVAWRASCRLSRARRSLRYGRLRRESTSSSSALLPTSSRSFHLPSRTLPSSAIPLRRLSTLLARQCALYQPLSALLFVSRPSSAHPSLDSFRSTRRRSRLASLGRSKHVYIPAYRLFSRRPAAPVELDSARSCSASTSRSFQRRVRLDFRRTERHRVYQRRRPLRLSALSCVPRSSHPEKASLTMPPRYAYSQALRPPFLAPHPHALAHGREALHLPAVRSGLLSPGEFETAILVLSPSQSPNGYLPRPQ